MMICRLVLPQNSLECGPIGRAIRISAACPGLWFDNRGSGNGSRQIATCLVINARGCGPEAWHRQAGLLQGNSLRQLVGQSCSGLRLIHRKVQRSSDLCRKHQIGFTERDDTIRLMLGNSIDTRGLVQPGNVDHGPEPGKQPQRSFRRQCVPIDQPHRMPSTGGGLDELQHKHARIEYDGEPWFVGSHGYHPGQLAIGTVQSSQPHQCG